MFKFESPHGGDSNEYTQYTIFNIKRKSHLVIPNLQLWDLFQRVSTTISNSGGKRVTEGILYIDEPLKVYYIL